MLPSLFISHGSPMLALEPGDSGPALRRLVSTLTKPHAVVVVSAHWETDGVCIGASNHPDTWHDFRGFPEPLYALRYPANGSPEIAATIQRYLTNAGIPSTLDHQRPLDHGAWVPLMLMYPEADIPVIQISLPRRGGAELQLLIGAAMRELRTQDVLLIGSGSITHNLAELDWRETGTGVPHWAQAFRDWIVEKSYANDRNALTHYRSLAPHALQSHPSEEHLLPFHFALGAGEMFEVVHAGFTHGALGMDIYRFD
ncbi:DODA-type extradiol aromatic ring-opening family dioxygenase [Pseudomonas matsuisoli]|uniref:Dioxygenase n=1 Tax=Pseudomonas matsuisoli TaxID=1515666 RepID=A0A917PHM3_9PSED|nr:class III extradiol ring-cleavage dioxygenase [Pseudomonas matsuisoli]GGJ79108.1 dioxygenase [Pseudomonas matsuisoli]